MSVIDDEFNISSIKDSFKRLEETCKKIEKLILKPEFSKRELQLSLSELKHQLQLADLSIEIPRIRPIISSFAISSKELYVLMFAGKDEILSKALKGDINSIIELISIIRSSIHLWETRILIPLTRSAIESTEGSPLVQSIIGYQTDVSYDWDAFISYATEDKESFVRELADSLQEEGIKVWYDDFELKVGDSLRQSIEQGLTKSRYGIVVLSPSFFSKEWPQRELSALLQRDSRNQIVVLPIWLNIGYDGIAQYSPLLADRVATKAEHGMKNVITDLLKVLKPEASASGI